MRNHTTQHAPALYVYFSPLTLLVLRVQTVLRSLRARVVVAMISFVLSSVLCLEK